MQHDKMTEISMKATETELNAALDDLELKTRFDELDAKYTLCELVESALKRETISKTLSAFPKRRTLIFSVSFGEGRPIECECTFAESETPDTNIQICDIK